MAKKTVNKDAVPEAVVEGRALVDIPSLGLRSGEYAVLPVQVVAGLAGQFDTAATRPVEF